MTQEKSRKFRETNRLFCCKLRDLKRDLAIFAITSRDRENVGTRSSRSPRSQLAILAAISAISPPGDRAYQNESRDRAIKRDRVPYHNIFRPRRARLMTAASTVVTMQMIAKQVLNHLHHSCKQS